MENNYHLMTGFLSAPTLIFKRRCNSAQRVLSQPFVKGVPSRLSWERRRGSTKTEVWLCFFILSFLGTSARATGATSGVLECLKKMKDTIEKSDALLYAPSIDDIGDCKIKSLKCYILELRVIMFEEDILQSNESACIMHFYKTLPSQASSDSCPPCEAHIVKNTTVFLERLITLLQSMN